MPDSGGPGLHLGRITAPPPGAWLTERGNPQEESVARDRKKPQQSAERRAGPRHGPVISERSRRWIRPRGGSPGAAYPHQRLSAFCSPHFFQGERKTDEGHRPLPSGPAERWLFDNPIGWTARGGLRLEKIRRAERGGELRRQPGT